MCTFSTEYYKLGRFVSTMSAASAHEDNETHCRLLRKAIARRHGQVALVSIRIVMELICVQRSPWRRCAIGVAIHLVRVHGRAVLVPKGVWSRHVSFVLIPRCFRAQYQSQGRDRSSDAANHAPSMASTTVHVRSLAQCATQS